MRRGWLQLWLVCFWLAAAAGGQPLPPGQVLGRVVDASQVPLQGVRVQLIRLTDAKSITAHTDLAGSFSFSELRSGRYSLAFDLEGYAMRRLGPYEVLRGVPLEVTAELPRLSPPLTRAVAGLEGMALEYGLVREQIASVPVMLGTEGRTGVDKMLLLVPGMSPVEPLETDPFSGRGAAVSANGSRQSAINYKLDGAFNNAQNRLTGSQAVTFGPAPEAIETFRVITHTYSAQEGRNAGAVVAPVTRGGGADWHGQLRGYWRPHMGNTLESFDQATDSLEAFVGGGQAGGPLWRDRGLFLFVDAEGWLANRRHTGISRVLTLAERAGDFSGSAQNRPVDPVTGAAFPGGRLPQSALDPLMQRYLDTFLPLPNVAEDLYRSRNELESGGQMFLGRIDYRQDKWSLNLSHLIFRNTVLDPLSEVLQASPDTVASRRQLSHSVQISLTHTPTPRFSHTTRLAGQRLSIHRWQGHEDYHDTAAQGFGFDFESFGANPGTLPDVRLFDSSGVERLHIAPFLFAESSVQTTFQASNDLQYRRGAVTLRAGALWQRGIWPFSNTENFAGSFEFGQDTFRGARNSVANLLMGLPLTYRLQTPRSLNLRWHELAFYGETELRPVRGLQFTLGLRFESQPPAVDRLDRIAAFRTEVVSQRFKETLPNLIFPGDPDGEFGVLPRSTVSTDGRNLAPRVGLSYSPTSESRLSRWILGESGRSVIRASYGLFYDFGTFAGSSASALFRATYPPWSVDNRFDYRRLGRAGSFQAPLGTVPAPTTGSIISSRVTYPILVFDRDFENARAHHWTAGWERLLPARVRFSAIYVGTQALRLQRQKELNVFQRNPLFGFGSVLSMRRFSQYQDIRQFDSSGSSRYQGLQLRATRYLVRRLAFDINYTWSRSEDDGSSAFGDSLVTEEWSRSSFDRTHTWTASWFYQMQLPRGWADRVPWADNWHISGIWRWRSGLPLDIRQTQDPTFSFQRAGRPDLVGEFRLLDPSQVRTFTLNDGRTVTGRFAFDPTAFQRVTPTNFDQVRTGTTPRNAFPMQSFQQWDLRLSRPAAISEAVSMQFGFDFINLFNNKNWDFPFRNIDDPYFGIVRTEGVGRTFQVSLRFEF